MEPVGDQLYQIFQDGYHRAASGSPIGASGVPPSLSYNGVGYPTALTPAGGPVNDFSSGSGPHNFIQSNGWNPYPGSDLDFPPMINRGGFNSQQPQQQPQQQQQQQSQLYHSGEFYGGPLELNPTIANFNSYPPGPPVGTSDLMMPDPFNPAGAQCLDYNNPAPVYPGSNVWPKQELQLGYGSRSVLEQEDVKGVFTGLPPPSTEAVSNNYYGDPSSSDGLLGAMSSRSPTPSHPASPRSPASSLSMGASLTDSSYSENSKRKAGGGKAASAGAGRGKRKKTDPDHIPDPVVRVQKEKDRRVSNNSRERMRIRDINDALTELGRVCMTLKPLGKANAEKPQTKLGVLNMAVDVIMQLEKKVRDRNLNPSTVALHHRSTGGATPSGLSVPSSSSGAPTTFQNPFPPSSSQMPPHQR